MTAALQSDLEHGFFQKGKFPTSDEYQPQSPVASRLLGKNASIGAPRSGANPDALLDKEFRGLHKDDPYVDPSKRARLGRDPGKNKGKMIAPKDFVYSSPSKTNPSPGSYYGCLQKTPYEHLPDDPQTKADRQKVEVKAQRNFTTAPSRKGTYGFPNIGISGDPEYMPCPEPDPKARLGMAAKTKARFLGGPFKCGGQIATTFDDDKKVYAGSVPAMPDSRTISKTKKGNISNQPFKPSNPGKKGQTSLVRYEHKGDPDVPAGKKAGSKNLAGKWNPTNISTRSYETPSIAAMAIGYMH